MSLVGDDLPECWCVSTIEELCELNPKHPSEIDANLPVSFVPMAAVCEVEGQIIAPEVRAYADVRFAEMGFPIPPLEEQYVIVRRTRAALEKIKQLKRYFTDSQSKLTMLDQSILAKAFRGELVPQDLNDEPASILLERIRAERAGCHERRSCLP